MEFIPNHFAITDGDGTPGERLQQSTELYPLDVVSTILNTAYPRRNYDLERLAELVREAGAIYLGQRAQEPITRRRQIPKKQLKMVSDLAQRLRCAVLDMSDDDGARLWGRLGGWVTPVDDTDVVYSKERPRTPEPWAPRHFPDLLLDREGTLRSLLAMSERTDYACKHLLTSPRNRPNDLVLGNWIECMRVILERHLKEKFTFSEGPSDPVDPRSGRGKSRAFIFCQAVMARLDGSIMATEIETEIRKNIRGENARRRSPARAPKSRKSSLASAHEEPSKTRKK